ncbi:MAG: hypothetical protein RugAbin2_01093 [Rugosibacter sp.]|nr:hypothetical protein [Rugosibacter sp.]
MAEMLPHQLMEGLCVPACSGARHLTAIAGCVAPPLAHRLLTLPLGKINCAHWHNG